MKKVLFLFFLFLFLFHQPVGVYAEIIRSFDVNVTAHKNGLMDVAETINYDFESFSRHGIYRYIPLYTKVGDLFRIIKISSVSVERDGEAENFVRSQDNQNVNIKIGNANKTITGSHVYKISYIVENGIGSNFADHDEIYWNATGNGWQVDIQSAKLTINNDFGAQSTGFICFTGSYGSKEKNCQTTSDSTIASGILSAGSGLTGVVSYPVGTFPKSILSKNSPGQIPGNIIVLIILSVLGVYFFLNIILPVIIFSWYQKHKNKKRFGIPAVNFDIPKNKKGERIAPALAGTIDSAKLERDDVVATIFDLAIRKYIRLEELKKPKKVLGVQISQGDQSIIKLNEPGSELSELSELNEFEKRLFSRLFLEGNSVKLSDLKSDFYETFKEMEDDVFKALVAKEYYTKNPKVQKALLITGAVFSLVTLNIVLGGALLFLGIKLNGRTPLGDEVDFKIDGLKLFLKSMDRNYKWQADQLYIVEKMIPYAMALGYIDKFMEQLKIIKPDYNPTWYHGYAPFYVGYGSFYSAASTNMVSSTSSGAGGGGFSGGGGGGGGGGSW